MSSGQSRVLVLLLFLAGLEAVVQPTIKTWWQNSVKSFSGTITSVSTPKAAG